MATKKTKNRAGQKSASKESAGNVQRTSRYTAPSQRRAGKGPDRWLVHLAVADEVMNDIDTLLWLRVTAAGSSVAAESKQAIYDEAVNEFLAQHENLRCEALAMEQPKQGWRTLWLSRLLYQRCKPIADSHKDSLGRVVSYALEMFVARHVTPSMRKFRLKTTQRANELLKAQSGK